VVGQTPQMALSFFSCTKDEFPLGEFARWRGGRVGGWMDENSREIKGSIIIYFTLGR